MPIYWDQKEARLHKKRVQLLQDWFGTPTWRPFRCFGTPTGTLRSDNGNEKVAEKYNSRLLKFLIFAVIQATRLLESREVKLELKRGDCVRVQGEIVKLERLRFTFTPNGKRQIQVENF